jgi:hypothetical protein
VWLGQLRILCTYSSSSLILDASGGAYYYCMRDTACRDMILRPRSMWRALLRAFDPSIQVLLCIVSALLGLHNIPPLVEWDVCGGET